MVSWDCMEQRDFIQIGSTVRETLQSHEEVLFCYVFGSLATGTARKGSDVDVAVYLAPEYQKRFFDIRLDLTEQLTRALSREVDIVVLNTAAPFLKYAILKEGKLVFERDREARINFELKALNEYFDYRPILKQYRDRLRTSV